MGQGPFNLEWNGDSNNIIWFFTNIMKNCQKVAKNTVFEHSKTIACCMQNHGNTRFLDSSTDVKIWISKTSSLCQVFTSIYHIALNF